MKLENPKYSILVVEKENEFALTLCGRIYHSNTKETRLECAKIGNADVQAGD